MLGRRKAGIYWALGCVIALVLGSGALAVAWSATGVAGSSHLVTPGFVRLRPGPWGNISCQRITLAPPQGALPDLTGLPTHPTWALADTDAAQAADLLARADLSEEQFHDLVASLHPDPPIRGFRLTPAPQLVQRLAPASRRALYNWMAQDARNLAIVNAYRYYGPSITDWLGQAGLSPRTRDLVTPLIYRNGTMLFFADLPLVLPQISDPQQRQCLVRALATEATLILRLHVQAGEDVEPLVSYWGQGSREEVVRPLLQSLADSPGGGSIDVVHLLPPFARAHLYTYPGDHATLATAVSNPTDRSEGYCGGDARDCHWSALNFFSVHPDDHFTRAAEVTRALVNDFVPVAKPQMGDLVEFRSGGEIFHSAVYIADDIVFTKNGGRFCRPWMLLPLSAMRDFYPQRQAVQVLYLHRRS